MAYLMQLLIAFDQLFNAVGNGWADETLSARAYRKRNDGMKYAYHFINALFFWQDNHCKQSFISEKKRQHLPPEYR